MALAHGERLLASSPALAEQQAQAILDAIPGSEEARLLMGKARLRNGDAQGARAVLEPVVAEKPSWAPAQHELGLACAALGDSKAAIKALQRAGELGAGEAWRALGDQLSAAGDSEGADKAYARHIQTSVKDPELLRAAAALVADRLSEAEPILRERLKAAPTDVVAIRMLAEVAARLGRDNDAEALLERCLELAPGFLEARHNYAVVLNRRNRGGDLLREARRLLAAEPQNPAYRSLEAAGCSRTGEFDKAIAIYQDLLRTYRDHAKIRLSLGHVLKAAGRSAETIAAYEAITVQTPRFGEAWWSLANLKTYRFSPAQIEAMEAALKLPDLSADDRLHLEFALGKALEDQERWAESFEHYAAGNRVRRDQVQYDPTDLDGLLDRSRALLTPAFFAERSGQGCAAPDPIFVVGLPRSGSTLVEQILASHPEVEGTQELPEIISIVRAIGKGRGKERGRSYPQVLAELDAPRLKALGEEYLERTRIYRKTARPLFIDKMPNNFAHVGLIQLILPNAKIVDVRRHPMAVGFAAYKQHFASGQHFSYDLEELGLYYRDYVALMAHYDQVLPGRVHRVIYEQLVDDLEGQVRRLLAYCGLGFDEACLRFFENDRAVRTASAEQVRQPIFKDAVDRWRAYEPWLGPLKAALGPTLETYANPPPAPAGI